MPIPKRKTKDVMIFGIQRDRILALLFSAFYDIVRSDPQKDEKYDASVRKSCFLCLWGSEVYAAFDVVHTGQLLFWPAYRAWDGAVGENGETDRQKSTK